MISFSSVIKVLSSDDDSDLFVKLHGLDVTEFLRYAKKNIKPEADNNYIADDEKCHGFAAAKVVNDMIFSGEEMQTGWCFGGGVKMNGMEWHESPEVVIACDDTVLLLGSYDDIIDDVYESKKTIAVTLKRGEAVMLKPYTLHLAPLAVNEFFTVAILLPKGTNLPLSGGIKGTHRAVNKWLLVHQENEKGVRSGGKIGVIGDNITLIK